MKAMPVLSRNTCATTERSTQRRRLLALTASLAILAGPLTAPAHANDAVKALDSFLETAKAWGASSGEYGEVNETAPNDAVMRDGKLGWDLAFKLGDADIDLDIRLEAPEVRLYGAKIDDKGYSFDKIEYPGAMTVSLSGGVTEDGERKSFNAVLTQYDAVTTGIFQPRLELAEDAEHPVSRFKPMLLAFLDMRIDESSARLIEMQVENQGSTQNDRYEGITYKGLANGRIEEQRIEKMTSVQSFPLSDGADAEKLEISQETGAYVVKGTDIRPLYEVLKIVPAGTAANDTIIESLSSDDMKISAKFGQFTVASTTASGITLDTDVEPVDALAIGDQAMLGTLPKDEASLVDLGRKALDILDGFTVASMAMDTIAVTSDFGNGTIDRIAVDDASYRGLGHGELTGVDVAVKEDNTTVKLDSFTLDGLTLPPLANYIDIALATKTGKPNIQEILAVVPMLSGMEMKGLDVASDDLPGPIKLDSYSLSMDGFIDPIPTSIAMKTVGAQMPVELVDDRNARKLLQRLGLTQVAYADELSIRWDPDTLKLSIDPMTMSIDGGGSATFTAEVGGIPRLVFENPENAQAALATATLISARLEVKDAKLVSAYIEGEAEKAGISAETLSNALADQAAAGMGPLAGTPFAKDAEGAVRAFLASPDELVVELSPNAPVPVTQILGLAATSPGGIPDLLGAAISANN
uniref:hypothetical protein n=1 Tax=Stappia sp. TaxID=1870903 RepID=UPI003BAAE317